MAVLKTYQSKGYIGKEGKAPIYISFYVNREKVVIPCGLSVKTSNFDPEMGKVTMGEKRHKDMNLMINNIRARINNVMVKYRLKDKELTKATFMREYNRPDDFKSFYDYFDYYRKQHPYEIELSTLDVHIDVINKMKAYAPELHFDEVTEDWVLEYKTYLKKKLKNKESTITKNLAVIKKYARAAIKEGYMNENPFENIKISRNMKCGFEFLTEVELNTLVDLYKEQSLAPNYQSVLQFFLFLCFSSLHIGDAKALRIEQINQKTFTYYRLKNRNSKPEPIVVPISKPARFLIKKVAGKRRNGPLFETLIADQKINEYIKKIAAEVGIDKKLSCKAGRHTFATLFLSKTKDMATLKSIMGHSDYRETLIYAHVLADSKLDGIKAFNDFEF